MLLLKKEKMVASICNKMAIILTIIFLPSVISSNVTMEKIFESTAQAIQSKDIIKMENMLYKNYFTSEKG